MLRGVTVPSWPLTSRCSSAAEPLNDCNTGCSPLQVLVARPRCCSGPALGSNVVRKGKHSCAAPAAAAVHDPLPVLLLSSKQQCRGWAKAAFVTDVGC